MSKIPFARAIVLAVVLLFVPAIHATAKTPGLPSYVTLPSDVPRPNEDNLTYEALGEAQFYPHDTDNAVVQRGRHWHAGLSVKGLPDETAEKTVWSHLKPSFLASGWTVSGEYDGNPFSSTLHYQKGDTEAWANVTVFGPGDIRVDIVELAAQTTTFALNAPAATPERIVAEHGDFPYLAPLPGSKFASSKKEDGPMQVTLPGSDEVELVGAGSITKEYTAEGLSNLQFVTLYHDAFVKAAWTVVNQSQSMNQSDAGISAHYTKNGRDIWANLHGTPGDYTIQVADAGAKDLGAQLAASCHVALYGVLFDFSKATLKPESDPVLGRVLVVLQKNAALKVEIQGHTDNVGSDAYNQKLSEARSHSVVAWLVQLGIAANRLTATGYGKTRPVATNDTDEGRAKNRRVEIAKPGCQGK
jgi:outer membrane protein OmpA-like peptidoglycan-associated protein